MASFNLLQHTDSRFESPAKLFAKLKSKVQKEAMCAKEGIFTSKDLSCNVRGKDEAEFLSPRRKAASTWTAEELRENQRFNSYRNEAQPLTLSPISSPQKTFDYTCSVINSIPSVETSGGENKCGCTRRDRAVLESTAVSQPLSLVNRDQIDKRTHHITDMGGLNVSNRTPVKRQPVENYGKDVLDAKCGLLSKAVSPGNVFSPVKNRLRKRKWEQQEFIKDCRPTKERNEDTQPPQERKTALVEDFTLNNSCMQGFGNDGESSLNQPEVLHEPMFPPRSAIEKHCSAIQKTVPIISPAKMFAYMKRRESKKIQQEVHNSSKRDLFGRDNPHHSGHTFLSRAHNVGEMERIAFGSAPERMVSVSPCRAASTDCLSDTDRSEDVLTPAASPQPILLEDPLVLNSPQISIPKTQEPVFKRNCWPKQKKIPFENVIYLKKWFLRKNHKGLFVDGIHNEKNIPWNSNIIVDRISHSVLRTVSGKVYILVGKMKTDVATDFPKWLLEKFASGFPHNWKALYEQFLQESKDRAERNSVRRNNRAKTNPDVSSINQSVNGPKQNSMKTPEFRPPTSSSSTKVTRSGRMIKPPLDYWKGGRVIVDAHMNVTIFEGYNDCQSETSTIMSPRSSQTPVCVMEPSSKGWKQSKSVKDERSSVPVRRVDAVRKHNKAVVSSHKRPTTLTESSEEMLSSPEEWCGRMTRSSHRRLHLAAERGLYVNAAPQKQSEPSAWRSKQQTHDINRPSMRVLGRKQTVTNSPESPPVNNKALKCSSSDEEISTKEKKRMERGPVKKRGKDRNKSQPDHKPSSNQSPERSERGRKAHRQRTRDTRRPEAAQTKQKESRSTKRSPQAKPLLKSKQSSKKDHPNKGGTITPQDEDEWTEAELMALQEAVSYYPKNIRGYWANVARMVGTRSAEECHKRHTSLGASHTPAKRANKKAPAPKPPEPPVISAGVGTFKRKQQVRQFLESQPREDVDDAFSSAYMQNKRFEIPSLCLSDDQNFDMLDLEPQTPMSSHFLEAKTPQCLHITPGMMGSPNSNNNDKYVYQLQKRMKKNQFNVRKNSPSKFTPTPSLKRRMRRCVNTENDTFVVWEMLGENDGALSDSEEEDFYFSDN